MKDFTKLNLFYDQIIGSEVFLRLDKSDRNLNKTVEIKAKHSW